MCFEAHLLLRILQGASWAASTRPPPAMLPYARVATPLQAQCILSRWSPIAAAAAERVRMMRLSVSCCRLC